MAISGITVALVLSTAVGVAYAAIGVRSGGAVTAVISITESSSSSTTSTSYTNIPNAAATVNVPGSHVAMLLIRFSGESICSMTTATTEEWCSVRLTVDGLEQAPISGNDYAFDSPGASGGAGNPDQWESHAMERAYKVGGGSHTVRAQFRVTTSTVAFGLDDWNLTVEKITVS
jgi:hypothetical protein